MNWRKIASCAALLTLSLGFAARADAPTAQVSVPAMLPIVVEGYTLSAKTDKQQYSLGETVRLSATLTNVSKSDGRPKLGYDLKQYKVQVISLDGKPAPLTLYGQKLLSFLNLSRLGSGDYLFLLKAGEKIDESYSIGLNRMFNMSLEGKYQILVSRTVMPRDRNWPAILASPSAHDVAASPIFVVVSQTGRRENEPQQAAQVAASAQSREPPPVVLQVASVLGAQGVPGYAENIAGPILAFTVVNNSKTDQIVDGAGTNGSPIIIVKPNGEQVMDQTIVEYIGRPVLKAGESRIQKSDAFEKFMLLELNEPGTYRLYWQTRPDGSAIQYKSNEILIVREKGTPVIDRRGQIVPQQ